ncbi:HesA/MoeB/ThiF family protein [Sphingobacterium sp.]|uniref:HesA/MoeB/ThiF family protein n=1 Tax=Sphingobacterium sp. TaxID=341027 RepID=UPI0028A77A81|nr:HesA/MoeB/ThiF family protein [Sphingobacterium sp.]
MDKEFSRYSRQIFMEEVSIEGQRKIGNARVLVIGAGGLGSPVIQYLAAAGVGKLASIDFDIVEIHNLNRQVIHQESFIGKPKVESAQSFVSQFNSGISFEPINQKLNKENIEAVFSGYDIIVDGSDNFETRYLVNDQCIKMGKTLVYGSIFSFEGQVAVFNYEGSKNLRDIFPSPPNPEDVQNCDQFGVLGALAGITGTMMAMLTLKVILGLNVPTNQLTIIDSKNWNFNQIRY